jgi:hypothetical protein
MDDMTSEQSALYRAHGGARSSFFVRLRTMQAHPHERTAATVIS